MATNVVPLASQAYEDGEDLLSQRGDSDGESSPSYVSWPLPGMDTELIAAGRLSPRGRAPPVHSVLG
jgi:hypothetical protein